jgi:hypothetical protein
VANAIRQRMYRIHGPREGRSIVEAITRAVPNETLRMAVIGQGGVETREEWYFGSSGFSVGRGRASRSGSRSRS